MSVRQKTASPTCRSKLEDEWFEKLVLDLIEALQVVESDLLDIGLFLPSLHGEATARSNDDRWRPACFSA